MSDETVPHDCFTVAEAARILEMPENTLRKRVSRGTVPTVQIGWRRYIRGSTLAEYEQELDDMRELLVGYIPLSVAARQKGVSMVTLDHRAQRGSLPAKKLGNRWYIKVEDLDLCDYRYSAKGVWFSVPNACSRCGMIGDLDDDGRCEWCRLELDGYSLWYGEPEVATCERRNGRLRL